MKSLLKLLLPVVLLMTLLLMGGCGAGSGGGSKEPEPFTLGDNTYKLEKVKKTSDGYEA